MLVDTIEYLFMILWIFRKKIFSYARMKINFVKFDPSSYLGSLLFFTFSNKFYFITLKQIKKIGIPDRWPYFINNILFGPIKNKIQLRFSLLDYFCFNFTLKTIIYIVFGFHSTILILKYLISFTFKSLIATCRMDFFCHIVFYIYTTVSRCSRCNPVVFCRFQKNHISRI